MTPSLAIVSDEQPDVDDVELILDETELIASICRESFYQFVLEFWGEVNAEPIVDNWHIQYLCDEAQKSLERVFRNEPRKADEIINIPPGESKSTIFSIMLLPWAWTRMPHLRCINASHTHDLVLDLSLKCRDVITSKKYQDCFPDITLREDQNTKGHFKNTLGGMRFCCTVGGKTPTGMHSHILVVDDPIDPHASELEQKLKNANRFMTAVIPSRRISQEVSVMFLIMQRLHEDDPTGHLLEKAKGGKMRLNKTVLPAELCPDLSPSWLSRFYKRNDGLLDAKRLSQDVLVEMRERMGEVDYAGQYGQRPTPAGGALFKINNLRFAEEPSDKYLSQFEWIVRYWDKAATEDGGAETAGVKVGRILVGHTKGVAETKFHEAIEPQPIYDYWILDVEAGQWGTEEREDVIRHNAETDGRDIAVRIEREPGSSGVDSTLMTLQNLFGWDADEDLPTGDKVVRARPFSKEVNSKHVVVVRAPWNEKFTRQLQYFPRGKYKDIVDASSGAVNTLMRGQLQIGIVQ